MIDIILSVATWLIPSDKVKESVKDMMAQRKVDAKGLKESIKNLNLDIVNDGNLTNEVSVHKRSTIFFPVVPRKNLSTIHQVFARAISGLSSLGLNVKIFIFDDYYAKVNNCQNGVREDEIMNFIAELTQSIKSESDGKIRSNSISIVKESEFLSKPKNAQEVLFHIRELSAKKTIAEIRKMREDTSSFTKLDDQYIRQEKILFNLSYASMFDNIGYILCGEDEVPMWEDYVRLQGKNGESELSQLVILYIPKMKNSSGKVSSIWDPDNYSTEKNKDVLRKIVIENLRAGVRNIDCGAFYILDNLYFSKGKEYRFRSKKGGHQEIINNVDELIEEIGKVYDEEKGEPTIIIDDLVDCIYKVMHEQRKEKKQNG